MGKVFEDYLSDIQKDMVSFFQVLCYDLAVILNGAGTDG